MKTLTSNEIHKIHGGNLVIPMLASIGIGACTGVLTWSIKNAYQGNTEKFNSTSNFLLEAGVGATISTLGTLGFVLAA